MRRPDHELELPECWSRPTPDLQRTLFSEATDQVLASLKVSRDDVLRWQANGWISFSIDEMDGLDWPHANEIEFVRNVARSGLLIAQINSLLELLPKPFRFSCPAVAYHFIFGWVVPTRDDPFDVIEANLDDWLDDLAEQGDAKRLQQIAEKITAQIEELDSKMEPE